MRPLQYATRKARISFFGGYIPEGGEVLEVGSGENWFRAGVANQKPSRYLTIDLKGDADIQGDILNWVQHGLVPGSFDAIVAFEVVEHVDCFAACFDLLKPGGVLLVTTPMPHMDWLLNVLECCGLTQRRTSPHDHLIYLRQVPRFKLERLHTPLGLGQWAVFRKHQDGY